VNPMPGAAVLVYPVEERYRVLNAQRIRYAVASPDGDYVAAGRGHRAVHQQLVLRAALPLCDGVARLTLRRQAKDGRAIGRQRGRHGVLKDDLLALDVAGIGVQHHGQQDVAGLDLHKPRAAGNEQRFEQVERPRTVAGNYVELENGGLLLPRARDCDRTNPATTPSSVQV
jgi:hypothetical protein